MRRLIMWDPLTLDGYFEGPELAGPDDAGEGIS